MSDRVMTPAVIILLMMIYEEFSARSEITPSVLRAKIEL